MNNSELQARRDGWLSTAERLDAWFYRWLAAGVAWQLAGIGASSLIGSAWGALVGVGLLAGGTVCVSLASKSDRLAERARELSARYALELRNHRERGVCESCDHIEEDQP